MFKSRRSRNNTTDIVRSAWKASRPGLLVVFLFSVFINILKFATPLYFIHVLDRVPSSRSVETLVMLTIAALAAILTGVALYAVRRRMLARWGIWIERRFGPPLLDQSLNSAPSDTSSARSSLGELSKLRSFVARSAAPWMDVIWAPLFFLGVYLIHPLLGTIAVVGTGILVVASVVHAFISRGSRRAAWQASNEAGQVVLTAERNIETVGALSMAPNLIAKWRSSVLTQLDERDRSEASATVYTAFRRAIGQCLKIGLIAAGIWLFLQNALTLGGLFAARILAGFGYGLVEEAAKNWVNLQEAAAAYRNIKAQFSGGSVNPVSFDKEIYTSKVLINDISFRYQGTRDYVFSRFKLEILPGELVLVIGGAATGKTTLSRLLVGRIKPYRGRINIGDIELARLPAEVRAELVGYLPQHAEILDGTIRQNIARMSEGVFEDIVAAAKRAGVHEAILRLPQGYDTVISDGFVALSGSERKRIALARAFYRTPRLIVLDEPAANLDWRSRRTLEAALKQLRKDGASVVVTQAVRSERLEKIADQVVTLGGRRPDVVRPKRAETKSRENLQSITALRSAS